MERENLVRDDFPKAHGTEGYDVDSVGAHLAAVAAHVAALEARVVALEVERAALRRELDEVRKPAASPNGEVEVSPTAEAVTHEHDVIASGTPGAGAAVSAAAPDSPSCEAVAAQEPDRGSAEPGAAPSEGQVAARLLATKLAMDGKGRDTIVMQLAAEHDVPDPGALVDDVLARLD